VIQKLSRRPGKGFRGVLGYCLEPAKQPEIIAGNTVGENARSLAREFADARAGNEAVRKPVFHGSLSADPSDQITAEKWREIAETYVERMGYGDSLWVAIRHRDTEHDHIHIIASRVRFDGQRVDDHRERKQGEAIVRQLEREHGLHLVAPSHQASRASVTREELGAFERTGQVNAKTRLQEHVELATRGRPTMTEFAERLRAQGVGIRLHIASTGRVSGISFELGGVAIKGSDLGRAYSWRGLQEKRGITYVPERDFSPLRSLPSPKPLGPTEDQNDPPGLSAPPMPRQRRPAQVYRTAAVLTSHVEVHERGAAIHGRQRAAGRLVHQAQAALEERSQTERWLARREADLLDQAARIYEEPNAAADKLHDLIQSEGHDRAGSVLATDPASFGRLRGVGVSWLKSEARKDALASSARLGEQLRDLGKGYADLRDGTARTAQAEATRAFGEEQAETLHQAGGRLPDPSELRARIAEAAESLGEGTVRHMRFSPWRARAIFAALETARRLKRYLYSPGDDPEEKDRGLFR
jgi:hypothetical protein